MEQKHYYTDEKNAQILIALLKAHGIKDIVISPGATNDCFVLSVQDDPDFKLYSAVDERHAGYLACGMAQETGRPVVINCTGATASRNYMSALTEAYYRKLPVIALTCSQHSSHIGQLYPQMTDRIHVPADVVNVSVQCPIPHTSEEEWACQLNVNRALLETSRHGGGPVHINLETGYNGSYTAEKLPDVTKVSRVVATDLEWPAIDKEARVVVWIGSHSPFTEEGKRAIENFALAHDAVVLTDLTGNYNGEVAIRPALLLSQKGVRANPGYGELRPDLIIHIGEMSGDYPTMNYLTSQAPVWRVNEDGELRDRLHGLTTVFEMPEQVFFKYYAGESSGRSVYRDHWKAAVASVRERVPNDIPFSNLWLASQLANRLPGGSHLHLGILNPLRCWNMTDANPVRAFSTVGGFGIDGGTSSMLGAALKANDVMHFGVFGDLAFFYDLNALGNRHLPKNLRILLVNNGEGGEFTVPDGIADNPNCGARVHDYIAAQGHYRQQSRTLVRHLAEDLGFSYLAAASKEMFEANVEKFTSAESERPVIFECFTDVAEDRAALAAYKQISPFVGNASLAHDARAAVSRVIPARMKNMIKTAIGR